MDKYFIARGEADLREVDLDTYIRAMYSAKIGPVDPDNPVKFMVKKNGKCVIQGTIKEMGE